MRLLIVEDDRDELRYLKNGFEAERFGVDTAGSGAEGSFMARTNPYDIIILDNILPGKHGMQVCKEIRTSGKTMPIIILSGVADVMTKVSLLDTGADDYVTKPYSFGELLARVNAILRRPPRFAGKILVVADLIFDTEHMIVERAGERIDLSKKELALLEFFMKNLGRVLSRAVIMENVWDMHGDPLSNTVETHIMNLRKKLERPGLPKLIHTIPTRGYKLAE